MCLVVILEDPDAVDPTERYKETCRGTSNCKPRFGAAIWERLRIHPGVHWWLLCFLDILRWQRPISGAAGLAFIVHIYHHFLSVRKVVWSSHAIEVGG